MANTPDVRALDTPTPAPYDDAALRDSTYRTLYNRGKGNYASDAVNQIQSYIAGLSPQQQLERAMGLQNSAGGQNINDFLNQRYSGVNSATDLQNIQAYKSFKDIVGRDPNSNEFAQIVPIFQQGNQAQANAWLSQYAEQDKQKPQNLQKQAPQYESQVNGVFNSILGRTATPDEISHFGGLLASGNVDSYGLQDFLKGTTEYQSGQDTKFRGDLASELQGYDQKFFDKSKQGLISQFAQQGQTLGNSSALDSALVDLMGQIADKRGSYLANLSSQQYGGNKDLALGNYQNTMNQYASDRDYARNQANQQRDYYQGRSDNQFDYTRQYNDYRDMNQGGKQNSNLGQLIGTVGGGATGSFWGPAGAQAGSQIGGGVGGGFDYYNNGRR